MIAKKTFSRPPIVAVLGHVDHGKTTLLDKIRKTKVAQKEAGGMTQSIGATQVDFKGKKITFVDTPGHAAFSKMRARGAQVTDFVVLVVAADDGVMPQTIESLRHIQEAKVPFLVAINKIDLVGAEPEKVKKQLADNGIKVEGYGGDVVVVPVSAKTGEGVEALIEMILLLAEMAEIKVEPEGELEAVVIESKKDKRGSVGTVIVRNGTLRVGEKIMVEQIPAKVRGLLDEKGKPVKKAGPGMPVEVLGFAQVPPVGAKVTRVEELPAMVASIPSGTKKRN
jgi:translation initiation factor IF-2